MSAVTRQSGDQTVTNHTVTIRVRTPLTLDDGTVAEIVSFDHLSDHAEHVALIFPAPAGTEGVPPLVRLHSECLTGDVFGSAHCDCGNQLHEALRTMGAQGGILIYLRQEGRGIGLYNKLDAYKAQHEHGLDTFAANAHIGFGDDLRDFGIAAAMLTALGVGTIRLVTNNPDKVTGLREAGIAIETVIPTGVYEKPANKRYLEAKRRHGHKLLRPVDEQS